MDRVLVRVSNPDYVAVFEQHLLYMR